MGHLFVQIWIRIDFEWVLAPPWQSLLEKVCHRVAISDVIIGVGIRTFFVVIVLVSKSQLPWQAVFVGDIINSQVIVMFSVCLICLWLAFWWTIPGVICVGYADLGDFVFDFGWYWKD